MQRMTLGMTAAMLILAGTAFGAEDRGPGPQSETRVEAQTRAARLFDRLDLNHDGKLDQADRAVHINAMFDQLDTNHDGTISRAEFAAAHAEGTGDHDGDDEQGGRRMGHWGYDRRELGGLEAMVLHQADPGHTGTVTRDGFVAAALALFDQADTNHDGILSPEEHHAAQQAARGHMGEHDGGDGPPPAAN